MSNLLFSSILTIILFEVVLLFYREYADRKEKKLFARETVFVTSAGAFEVMVFPLVGYWVGFFCYAIIKPQSNIEGWILMTTIALIITLLAAYDQLKWLHFTRDKIIIRNPLFRQQTEIDIKNVTRAGYKRQWKNRHYYMVVKQHGVHKTITLHTVQTDDAGRLADYFVSHGIEYNS